MRDVCGYANRPLAFVVHYVLARPIAHAVIVTAVVAAVTCSVAAQYGAKLLVDVLSAGVAGHAGAIWIGFLFLVSLIAADNLSWRLASWIASPGLCRGHR
jgi:ATP-binding cassette subfamily B protein